MSLLIFLLICYGTSNVLIFGSIFNWWRTLLSKLGTGDYSLWKLFTCMMCLPTWVGFLLSFVMIKFGMISLLPITFVGGSTLLIVFLHGLLATGGCWLIHTLQEHLEK